MRVSHRPTLNSNYKEFCRVNFELLRVLYRPNLNSFTSFRIIESSADKTSNYCVFKISLSSAHNDDSNIVKQPLATAEALTAYVFRADNTAPAHESDPSNGTFLPWLRMRIAYFLLLPISPSDVLLTSLQVLS
ncbi:hypothetical protein J6590_001085 [Homalodisca vitripennis]|nr:hypothetical protein J6590_001085 [Homalodisca vitripennis]